MKKNLLIICLFFININLFADDNHLFHTAEIKFKQEEWQKALTQYQKIQNKNSLVWQHVATCLFHLEKYPEAMVAVNRAFLDASLRQIQSLYDLENKINEKLHIPNASNFKIFLMKVLFCIPMLLIQLIFLLLLIHLFFILIRRYRWHDFTKTEKSRLKKILIILLLTISLWYLKTLSFVDDTAIVIKLNAQLHAGPAESFHTIKNLQPGSKVKILKKENSMYQITTSQYVGWVNIDVLEPVINHG